MLKNSKMLVRPETFGPYYVGLLRDADCGYYVVIKLSLRKHPMLHDFHPMY